MSKILETLSIWKYGYQKKKKKAHKRIDFPFNCNSCCVIYLLIWKLCLKQYVTSTVTTFRLRSNQHKSNIQLHGEGRRWFEQEKLIGHFFLCGHKGTH